MFTGIIEEIGKLRSINGSHDGASLVIGARTVLSDLKLGDSIAVDGPCLTVTAKDKDGFTAWVMPETLSKTNLAKLAISQPVNLERAMTLDGRLGGHLVSGHIDATVVLTRRQPQGGAVIYYFKTPQNLLRYIVPKGSVALDGVSLTVVDVDAMGFAVGLIPHTAAQTTLGMKQTGAVINLEVDIIGKYVEKLLQPRIEGGEEQQGKISLSMLQEKGYI